MSINMYICIYIYIYIYIYTCNKLGNMYIYIYICIHTKCLHHFRDWAYTRGAV